MKEPVENRLEAPLVHPAPVGVRWLDWAVWLFYGSILVILWPTSVVLRGDDFGYLESVVGTIRSDRLVMSDWLGPFNMVHPLIASSIWAATGRFYLSTYGLGFAIAAAMFLMLWRWLRPTLPPGHVGSLAVLAVALLPTFASKTVEFTSIPLGFALTLGALCAWRSRSSVWFFILVLIGFLNRQSALCLLVLPAFEQIALIVRRQRVDPKWVGGGLLAVALMLSVVILTPNNLARSIMAKDRAQIDEITFAMQSVMGITFLCGIAAGWAVLRGEVVTSVRQRTGLCNLLSISWLVLGCVWFAMRSGGLHVQTPHLWDFGPLFELSAFLLAALVPDALKRVAPEAIAAAAVYVVLVSWRGVWWDYYLCEPALILAAARSPVPDLQVPRVTVACVSLMLLLGVAYLYPLRWQLRWAERGNVAYERALREGRISIADASGAPMGFLGWKLFPALLDRGPDSDVRLIDFVKFVRARSSSLRGTMVTIEPVADSSPSMHGSGELWKLPDTYRPRVFPLNDAEWREFLQDKDR